MHNSTVYRVSGGWKSVVSWESSVLENYHAFRLGGENFRNVVPRNVMQTSGTTC